MARVATGLLLARGPHAVQAARPPRQAGGGRPRPRHRPDAGVDDGDAHRARRCSQLADRPIVFWTAYAEEAGLVEQLLAVRHAALSRQANLARQTRAGLHAAI